MIHPAPIRFWNRRTQSEEEEFVYGDKLVRFLYETASGQRLTRLLSMPWLSRLYGAYQNSGWSRRAIERFIQTFHIKMEEYEPGPYPTFNEFFIRRFMTGMRPFAEEKNVMPAFTEGRYLAFDAVVPDQVFPVKGEFLSAGALLGNKEWTAKFEQGPLVISRLCPVDYHRFHFPDDGRCVDYYRLPGALHSVNPLALRFKGDIFATNERQVSILETENFGLLAYIEVGAMCVGKIVQTHGVGAPFIRGDEKGYFLFGASTVILMGEKGSWHPDGDILDMTSKGMETFVPLGEHIAVSG